MKRKIQQSTSTHHLPIDDDERDFRIEVVEEAIRMNAANGYRIDRRSERLCQAYVAGELELDELRMEIIRPHLH